MNEHREANRRLTLDRSFVLYQGGSRIGALQHVGDETIYDPSIPPLSGRTRWSTELDLRHWVEQTAALSAGRRDV